MLAKTTQLYLLFNINTVIHNTEDGAETGIMT